MKIIDIIRPQIVNIDTSELRAELLLPIKMYYEEDEELVDIFIAPTLILTQTNSKDEKPELLIDPKMFDKEIFDSFNKLTYSLGKMVRLAELNLDSLSSIIELYLTKNPVSELVTRNYDCKKCKCYFEKNFNILTFENLKCILSCIVKTDTSLYNISELNTPEKRKNFTSIYTNYIEDRNRFTHGKLFFLYPNFEPVLRVKSKEYSEHYITYEKKVFISNLLTFDYLNNILVEIAKVIDYK
ncbi:MAG: hypothetical protein RLZZ306_344 [Bacteroidota bacterium]|jgi:hypothetical protein